MNKKLLFIIFITCFLCSAYSQNRYNTKPLLKQSIKVEKKLTSMERFIVENKLDTLYKDYEINKKYMILPDAKCTFEKRNKFNVDKIDGDVFKWKELLLLSKRDGYLYFLSERDTISYCTYKFWNELNENLISLEAIDKAKTLLTGKRMYILVPSNEWDKDKIGPHNNLSKDFIKYIPITVMNVGIGDSYRPFQIVFKTDSGNEHFLNVKADIDDTYYVKEYFLASAFSFNDPRPKNTKESFWSLIKKGKVIIGMTKKECEMSWGKPDDINKSSGVWGSDEQWVYGNSSYLYFRNGILNSIQN